jgi:hypothetical protein
MILSFLFNDVSTSETTYYVVAIVGWLVTSKTDTSRFLSGGAEENDRTFQVRIPGDPVYIRTWRLMNTSPVRLQEHMFRA